MLKHQVKAQDEDGMFPNRDLLYIEARSDSGMSIFWPGVSSRWRTTLAFRVSRGVSSGIVETRMVKQRVLIKAVTYRPTSFSSTTLRFSTRLRTRHQRYRAGSSAGDFVAGTARSIDLEMVISHWQLSSEMTGDK